MLAEGPWLRRLAGRISTVHGDDLAQDALLVAITGPAPRGRLRSWLAGILRNLARETRRGEMRRVRREVRAARTEPATGPADLAARAEAQARVAAALRDLPEPCRSTVLLRFFEGLSLAEIARREGVSGSTVRNRLRRALARLRSRLEEEFGGTPLALAPLAAAPRRPRLSFGRIAAAAALLAGAVYAGTPRELPKDPPRPAAPKVPHPLPEPPPVP